MSALRFPILVAASVSEWTDPAESPRHIAWTRGLATAMERFGSGALLLNALGEEGDDAIKAAFGPNYERLAALK